MKIVATRTYRKRIWHNGNKESYSWIIIDDNKGLVAHINTYGGTMGNIDINQATKKLYEDRAWENKIKRYELVPVDSCPIAKMQ